MLHDKWFSRGLSFVTRGQSWEVLSFVLPILDRPHSLLLLAGRRPDPLRYHQSAVQLHLGLQEKNILLFALKIFHYFLSNLDPGAVCEQDGEREAVHQAEAPLLAVDADVADEVVAAPEHGLPLRHEVVLVAIIWKFYLSNIFNVSPNPSSPAQAELDVSRIRKLSCFGDSWLETESRRQSFTVSMCSEVWLTKCRNSGLWSTLIVTPMALTSCSLLITLLTLSSSVSMETSLSFSFISSIRLEETQIPVISLTEELTSL